MPADPPAGAHIQQRWEEVLESAAVAEDSGFDGFFLPEHHFMATGFCSSPLIALAAIAARTRTLRLGTAVIVLPCYHPLKLAEDGAHLDLLSNGRLILGVGMGAVQEESRVFGVPNRELASRFEETLSVVQKAWTEDEFSFSGRHFSFSNVHVTPMPVQKPSPPIWMGGMSEPGVRRTGRMGLPWLTGLMPRRTVLQRWAHVYGEQCKANGHEPRVVVIRDGWVAEDRAAVQNVWWPYARQEHWRYVTQVTPAMAEMDPSLSRVRRLEEFALEAHGEDRLIVGTPDDVISSLKSFQGTLATDYVILRFRLVTGPSHQATLRCLRLFGREVIPKMR